jgi:hypothetical protein
MKSLASRYQQVYGAIWGPTENLARLDSNDKDETKRELFIVYSIGTPR